MSISPKRHIAGLAFALCAAAGRAGELGAAATDGEDDSAWGADVSVEAQVLGEMRGGMMTANGLHVNIGLQREVYVNGVLVSTTTLTLSDLTRLLSGAAPRAELGGEAALLVQTGAGNTHVSALADAATLATVIQNTLDNQVIRGVTQINADVSNMELLRGMAVTSSAVEMLGRSR